MLYYPILGSYCGLTIKSNCHNSHPYMHECPFQSEAQTCTHFFEGHGHF